VEANGPSVDPAVSGDGRFVAYMSSATNLVAGDLNGLPDIFVHDLVTSVTSRVSVALDRGDPNGDSAFASISADGRLVAFSSSASNLVVGDSNGCTDIFVVDRAAGTIVRASISTTQVQANGCSVEPAISGDGRYVSFTSGATNLVAEDDTNGEVDVFVRDLEAGVTTRSSHGIAGAESNGSSEGPPVLSYDGRYITFQSRASNLTSDDNSPFGKDCFVTDRMSGETTLLTPAADASQGYSSVNATIAASGTVAAFATDSPYLGIPRTGQLFQRVFVADDLSEQCACAGECAST
jgi:Tol biopolymer transport system component